MMSTAFVAALGVAMTGCGGDSGGSGGGAGGSGGSGGSTIDACAIVTESDATQLFGFPAVKDTTSPVSDPALEGSCVWSYDDVSGGESHLLQFYVWNGESYYIEPSGAQPVAVGDKGYSTVTPLKDLEIGWLHGQLALNLSYGTIGPSAPDPTTKSDALKSLAQKADGLLPK